MKKPLSKYLVYFSEKEFYETMAVSEKQAISRVKHQMGLAGHYDYHDYEPIKVEKIEVNYYKEGEI